MKPADSASDAGIHSGKLGPWRDAVAKQRFVVDPMRHGRAARGARARRRARRRASPIVHMPAGAHASNVPSAVLSAMSSIHDARSRASMNWTARSGGAGTTARLASLAGEVGTREPRDPVREAIGRIERTDDEPGANDERAAPERLADFVFATRLERAVVRDDVLGGGIFEGRDRRRFVEPGPARIRVHRQRRDERVVPDASFERGGGRPDAAGNVAARVDRGVPFTRLERRQSGRDARVAVADEMLDACRPTAPAARRA